MSDLATLVDLPELPTPNYEYITDETRAKKVLSFLDTQSILEVDTEGTALDPFSCRTTLIQIGIPNMAYIFDVRNDLPGINIHGSLFKDILTSKKHLKIIQNANYDMKVVKVQYGYYIENIYDTMLAEILLYLGIQKSGFSLAKLVEKYLGMCMNKEPRGTFEIYDQVYTERQLAYAANDVCVLDIIRNAQLDRINKYNLHEVLALEMAFTKPLAEMELNGIKLNTDKWRIMMKEFSEELEIAKADIENSLQVTQDQLSLFDIPTVNIASPIQLKSALNKLGLKVESTTSDSLKRYSGNKIIDNLLSYRQNSKLVNTYGEALVDRIHPKTGRLHTDFKQMVSTGRLSSNNPNLQNIPGKQKFRSCFIADDDKILITIDQNSAELIIMGAMSGEPNFIDTYKKGLDLHTVNASRVYNVPYDEVTSEQRKASKAISFGLCIAEDSSILCSSGVVKIKDISIGDVVAHDIGSDEVIDKKFMGDKECFQIETKYGYTLNATEDHEVKVIDVNGNYVDKKLKDINVKSDFVCLKKGSNLFPEELYVFDTSTYDAMRNVIKRVLPKTLDENMAKFLGTFVSEGSLQKNIHKEPVSVNFGFSPEVEEYLCILEDIFSSVYKKVRRNYYKTENLVRYNLSSKKFAKFVYDLCDIKSCINKTIDIAIPNCIKQSPKHIQAAFLSALYEGDGTIYTKLNRSQIEYSSMALNLCKDLQCMLLNFGILSSLVECHDKRYPDRHYYKVIIIGENSRRLFMSDIGFLTNHKNSKYTPVSYDLEKEFPSYSVPYQGDILNTLIEHVHESNNDILRKDLSTTNYKHRNCYRIGHRLLSCCRSSLNNKDKLNKITEKQLMALHVYNKQLSFIYENNIVPLPIKSIKSVGIRPVYDISVANRELFLANGFVVHNCYGISAVGLGKRLNISKDEAQKLINAYFRVNSALNSWLNKTAKDAIRTHSSVTITGRHRFYNIPPMSDPSRKSIIGAVERAAKNHSVQGSDSDTIKLAMILCVDRLEELNVGAKLILSVHDEIVIESPKEHCEEVAKVAVSAVDDAFNHYFPVMPMYTSPAIGPCWLKGACETKDVSGEKCGHNVMKFIADEHYGSKLVCAKCEGVQD